MPEENSQDEKVVIKATEPSPRPIPQGAPAPSADELARNTGNLNDDVTRILEEIKIPARPNAPEKPVVKPQFENVFAPRDTKEQLEKHEETKVKLDAEPHERKPRATPLADTEKAGMVNVMPSAEEVSLLNAVDEKPFDMRALHTLKDDLQGLVDDNKMSLIKATALEEEKRQKRDQVAPPPAHKSAGKPVARVVLIAATFIFLGILAFAAMFFVAGQRQTNVPPPLPSIMFSEQTLAFPLVQGRLASEARQQLALARNQIALTLGAIARIAPLISAPNEVGETIQRPASTEEFLRSIGAEPPESLVRALSEEFFFGVHALDENVPVLVVPVLVYERAFAGMIEWEKSINDELAPIFTAIPAQVINAEGKSVPRAFEDVIVQNYDVRILRDARGTVRFLYAFPTRDILIFAESPNSFVEILARLRAERRL
ncbi:MAG: hypothetical protein KBE09_00570 [Candidatus Pacebacteria bacterium]|nr:hypothetical protein [Candidatus Paceibacterota bacterium]